MAASAPRTKKKLLILLIIWGVLFLVLSIRLTQVMIINAPDLQEKALSQWTRRSNLTAKRGRIMDRNGLVLAQSGTAYRVLVNPQAIQEEDRVRIAMEVSNVLGLNYDYVFERVSNVKRKQAQLKRQVESSVVDQLTALQLGSGISFSTDQKRYYPFGQLFSQVIGFTGIDSEGQTGLEAEFDSYLAGENGVLVAEVDRNGNMLSYGDEDYIAPIDGYDMKLTVDSVTQSYLENYVDQCQQVNRSTTATGLIMNPKTGEILAISSYPSFDLNNPPRDQVTELMAMSRNRAVTDTFEPGSIFKVVTLAAALDSGAATMDSHYNCKGSKTFRLETVHCTKSHGEQTITEATENSCNCAYMEMGLTMGVDTFYDYIYAFGFDEPTNCGLPQEDTGEVIHRKYIRDADLARVAFGQTITCTAIQMVNAVGAAVNGGILMQPYIVDSITAADGTVVQKNEPVQLRRVINSATSTQVRDILYSVVENGSGKNARLENYKVGGKTGTAQKYDEDGSVSRTRLIASFIGFLPVDDPELVCLVTVDEPAVPVVYGSIVAAPWVQDVFTDLVQYYGYLPDRTEPIEMQVIPEVVGQSGEEADYAIRRDGFNTDLEILEDEKTATCTMTIPPAGTEAPAGSYVQIYTTMTNFNDATVSKGLVKVPKLIERRRQDAYDLLTKLGLKLSYDKTNCTGQIETQSIAEGEEVPTGTEVYVTFPVPTPDPETGQMPDREEEINE